MLSKFFKTLERGLISMRSNSRMLLVGILVFLFPVIFVWTTQSFFETSYNNIRTVESKRAGTLNDSLSVVLMSKAEDALVTDMIDHLIVENSDFTKLRVLAEDENGYRIIFAADKALVGEYEDLNPHFIKSGFTEERDFTELRFVIDDIRVSQYLKRVPTDSGYLYVFSEQDFSTVDRTMSYRRQQSYFGLTAIFLFIIALAYWLNRQVFWEKKHLKLQKEVEDRDVFMNVVAHEFRTPLTAIKGYASFLQESKNLAKEEMRYASNIRTSAERLVLLVSDFLEVSRLQLGKINIEKKEIDIREVLEQIKQDLSGLAKEKQLELIYEKTAEPIIFNTDKNRLVQILINITTNSIKYTDGGKVVLECIPEKRKLTIIVKDTGMGISAEDQQKLFAPFTRVGNVDKTDITGTGLGMWITKQLVTLLGGKIGVESIREIGTHVVITFEL